MQKSDLNILNSSSSLNGTTEAHQRKMFKNLLIFRNQRSELGRKCVSTRQLHNSNRETVKGTKTQQLNVEKI